MSSTPWSIQRTKRKQSTATPTPRKRVRIADDAIQPKSSRPRPRKQQTLTQIQFVNSPSTSFDDDQEFRELSVEDESNAERRMAKSNNEKSKNSTLTQMGWLGNSRMHRSVDMAALSPSAEQKDLGRRPIPQVDGTPGSPRRGKKRKSEDLHGSSRSVSEASIERETQDYKPPKRKGRALNNLGEKSRARRRSKRIAAKIFSDPGENGKSTRKFLSPGRKPSIGTIASTERDESFTPTDGRVRPQTPPRRYEVPSSQTPETVTKIKQHVERFIDQSPSKTSSRQPLRERSTNAILPPSSKKLKRTTIPRNVPQNSPARKKVCFVKSAGMGLFQQADDVDNRQDDMPSLQSISSPSNEQTSSDSAMKEGMNYRHTDQENKSLKVPSTSQEKSASNSSIPSSPPNNSKGESLPELQELLSMDNTNAIADILESAEDLPEHVEADQSSAIVTHHSSRSISQGMDGDHTNEEDVEVDPMLLDSEVPTIILSDADRDRVNLNDEHDSDFGSPVPNDTQFNFGLMARTSSPDVRPEMEQIKELGQGDEDIHILATPGPKQGPDVGEGSDNEEAVPGNGTLLPTPRLIRNRASPKTCPGQTDEITVSTLTQELPASARSTSGQSNTTQVPLIDVEQFSSSSSPLLPPVKPTIQYSIHPASMPRPSQISTQAPTQSFLPSSMPNFTQYHTEPENITIKDSSSVRLSQLPQYETQSQGLNVQLVDDSDGEIDDLDLDPSSAPQGRQSARKPTDLFRKETGSSLRSIHPSSDNSNPQAEKHSIASSSSSTHLHLSSTPIQRRNLPAIPQDQQQPEGQSRKERVEESDLTSSPILSSPSLQQLKQKHDPIPGFNNDTQANFTQNGHITAAYIHRQRETGAWPDWFVPQPFQVSNFKRSGKDKDDQ